MKRRKFYCLHAKLDYSQRKKQLSCNILQNTVFEAEKMCFISRPSDTHLSVMLEETSLKEMYTKTLQQTPAWQAWGITERDIPCALREDAQEDLPHWYACIKLVADPKTALCRTDVSLHVSAAGKRCWSQAPNTLSSSAYEFDFPKRIKCLAWFMIS